MPETREAGWRTIASAPRDGTEVLGCFAFKKSDGSCGIGWVADGYLDGDGWVFASFPLDADEYPAPNYWMPMLAPPALSKATPQGGTDETV